MKSFWWWFWSISTFLYALCWIHAVFTHPDRMTGFIAAMIACNAMARTYEEKPCTPTAT